MERTPAKIGGLNAVIRRWEFLALLIGCFVIQLLFGFYFPLAQFLDLSLILALYLGWYSTPTKGMLAGLVFGLAQDLAYGQLLGLNGLSKTLIGYTGSLVSKVFRFDLLPGRFAVIAGCCLLDGGIQYLTLLVLEQPVSSRFWSGILIKAAVTAVVGSLGSRFYDRYKFPRKDFRRVGVA